MSLQKFVLAVMLHKTIKYLDKGTFKKKFSLIISLKGCMKNYKTGRAKTSMKAFVITCEYNLKEMHLLLPKK